MSDKPVECCETCKFWLAGPHPAARGECRRYPPAAGGGVSITYSDGWCGEYKPEEDE